jgi:hypothetical protein
MGMVRFAIGTLAVIVMLVFYGCAGSSVSMQQLTVGRPGVGGTQLPPPSALHSASYTQQDLHQWGREFNTALPYNNVTIDENAALYSPNSERPNLHLPEMAYAIYQFQLDGYDLETALWFTWTGTGGYDNAWIGLSNFQRDRWDWQPLPFQESLAFDPARNVSDTGVMYVVVMCGGTLPWRLAQVRVGPEFVAPEVTLDALPLAGNAPLTVNFDASASFDPDGGSISKYEWDWEGDGIYDADTGTNATTSHTYMIAGAYPAAVRATDDDSNSSSASVDIAISDLVLDPDTLYAIPLATHVAVGEPVRILVATGQPAYPLAYVNGIGFTIEQAGTYVHGTYNLGIPGGVRTFADGYWALLGPPPPDASQFLDLGDDLLPGDGDLIDGGLRRLLFNITTMGAFDLPASIGNGAVLLNFELSFSAPGVYHPGFQLIDGAIFRTYYSETDMTLHYWSTLDGSNTITVE